MEMTNVRQITKQPKYKSFLSEIMIQSLSPHHRGISSIRIYKNGIRKRVMFDRDAKSFYVSRLISHLEQRNDPSPPSRPPDEKLQLGSFKINHPFFRHAQSFKLTPKSFSTPRSNNRMRTAPQQTTMCQTQRATIGDIQTRLEKLNTTIYTDCQVDLQKKTRLEPLTKIKRIRQQHTPLDFWTLKAGDTLTART